MKKLEYFLFICLNLFFSMGGLMLIVIMYLGYLSSKYISNVDIALSENYTPFIMWGILFYLVYIISKLILFPVLYSMKKTFPYIHEFFEKLVTIPKRKDIVLLNALFLDSIFIIANILYTIFCEPQSRILSTVKINISLYFVFGCGVILPYLVMFVWLKLIKHIKKH
ncbi:MAG: hypothetical protein KHX03_01350 [Clostridium sp.]|nr:hypothetical protein [Clostridium sp.]